MIAATVVPRAPRSQIGGLYRRDASLLSRRQARRRCETATKHFSTLEADPRGRHSESRCHPLDSDEFRIQISPLQLRRLHHAAAVCRSLDLMGVSRPMMMRAMVMVPVMRRRKTRGGEQQQRDRDSDNPTHDFRPLSSMTCLRAHSIAWRGRHRESKLRAGVHHSRNKAYVDKGTERVSYKAI
jgi:hypothetical protein